MAKLVFYVDKTAKTVATQNKYGKMTGRRKTKKGEKSDRTYLLRIKEGVHAGEIRGRTPPGVTTIRGTARARGYTRQL